ncbi:TolA-binding protein [Hydrogenivirga caldilitoris]|uniref:TolA-binding protein n=1 Tax=Hydrogenivirga caldilitoris TaxID=246264 RepID=A0A497XPL1_9AQUI|nr:tetratricopeptide repeat protein [Hydrogenivirga caldilitoris]RLJ70936.1 TolA-binding protein [Hydrogenivirga caldilitoris]
MRILPFFVAGALLAGCAPVSQQPERVSEVEIKLTRLEQKQADIEKDIEKTNERIDKLTELISELRLEIERLKLRLLTGTGETGQAPPKETSTMDTQARLSPEKVPVPSETGGEAPVQPQQEQQAVEDAETAYKKAIELYSVKKLYEARDAFLDFIKKFPENKYTDNAFFWIGKIYQELGDTQRAEEIYKSLVDKCEKGKLPECNKLPDAYFQLMRIYIDRGNVAEANKYYSTLIERFPTSDAAVRAREQKLLLGE